VSSHSNEFASARVGLITEAHDEEVLITDTLMTGLKKNAPACAGAFK
jgi:hypothetical protein